MAGPTSAQEAVMLDAEHNVSGRYLGLFTVAPTADAGTGGTEVSGGSYARVAIASTDWNAASAGNPSTKTGPKSGVEWAFPTATADWAAGGTQVVAWGIFSASSGGTLLHYGSLTTAVNVLSGQTVKFTSSSVITMQLGDPGDTF